MLCKVCMATGDERMFSERQDVCDNCLPDDTPDEEEAEDHEHEWVLTETGYIRTWHTEIDEENKTIRAYWGGSEDFSDGGAGDDHLVCSVCNSTRQVPEGFRVDFEY